MACFCRHGVAADAPIGFAEPGVRPHYAPDRVVRIERSTIRLTVDPQARTFSGQAEIELRALPTFQGQFALDLDDVEVDSVTGEGAPLDWEHTDGQVVIRAADVPSEVVIRWHGANPARGLYFTGPTEAEPGRAPMAWTQCQDEDGHFVFPCHDHPSVKHPWTLEITAPAGYTLLSNGRQIAQLDIGDQVRATFEQAEPMPAYLVTFVAAKLTVTTASWNGRPVRFLVPEGEDEHVERAFGRTVAMIDHFSSRFGVPYPWPRYDQVVVHDFVFGGMENTACTTMTDVLLVDPKANLEWQPDGLVAHELAHQWFGDLVTCRDWSQGWLNESWATYVEALWWEQSRSPADAIWYRWKTAQGYFAEASGRYARPIVSYDFREPIDVFDRHLYNKGSCVLWTLRHQLGDRAFWPGVKRYLEQNAHRTVHTRDFQRALEEVSGSNLDGFFAQWVHRAGHPKLQVKLGREHGQLTVTVTQEQEGAKEQPFDLVLRLEVVEAGEARTVDLHVTEPERTWVLVGSERAHVRVDPGYRVLAQITLTGPDTWLAALAEDPDPVLAVRAARALQKKDGRRAREALEAAFVGHPHWAVRSEIASQLAATGADRARDLLVARLGQESEPRVRRAIAEGLGRLRGEAAADALLALLGEELPTWQLEGAALHALGRTRDPRAVTTIRGRLGTQSWADWVRQRALEGLAHTRDAAVLPDLLAHTTASHGDRTRGAAAIALSLLAQHGEDAVRTEAVERLSAMVAEPGFRAQLAAISGLSRLRDRRALPALEHAHRTAPDGRTRRSAYEAMARIRRGRTSEAGLATLRDTVEQLQADSAKLRERIDRLEPPA